MGVELPLAPRAVTGSDSDQHWRNDIVLGLARKPIVVYNGRIASSSSSSLGSDDGDASMNGPSTDWAAAMARPLPTEGCH